MNNSIGRNAKHPYLSFIMNEDLQDSRTPDLYKFRSGELDYTALDEMMRELIEDDYHPAREVLDDDYHPAREVLDD